MAHFRILAAQTIAGFGGNRTNEALSRNYDRQLQH
jgi:hypothetical protein